MRYGNRVSLLIKTWKLRRHLNAILIKQLWAILVISPHSTGWSFHVTVLARKIISYPIFVRFYNVDFKLVRLCHFLSAQQPCFNPLDTKQFLGLLFFFFFSLCGLVFHCNIKVLHHYGNRSTMARSREHPNIPCHKSHWERRYTFIKSYFVCFIRKQM